jgi:uncharacterized protein YcnI
MTQSTIRRLALWVTAITALLLAGAAPAAAFPFIPDGDAVESGTRQVIHVRVPSGCSGQPTDRIEVNIPEGVLAVSPEAVVGWTTELERVTTEPYDLFGQTLTERVAVVRWSGGVLPADQFQDFGIDALFRVEPGDLVFPVIQGCGETEVAWTEPPVEGQDPTDTSLSAPTVRVVPDTDPVDLVALQESVDQLGQDLEDLTARIDELAPRAVENRIAELQTALDDLITRVEELEQAIADSTGG